MVNVRFFQVEGQMTAVIPSPALAVAGLPCDGQQPRASCHAMGHR